MNNNTNDSEKTKNFREQLKIRIPKTNIPLLGNKTDEESALNKCIKEKYEENELFNTNKEVQNYFKMLTTAILIEQDKYYENHDIEIPSRIKSKKSYEEKLKDSKKTASIKYNDKQEIEVKLKPIFDNYALKIILKNRPPIFASTDPEIQKLLEEKKVNQEFLEKMQTFKGELIEDEFSAPKNYKFKYNRSKKDYYENCKKLVERLRKNIHKNSTNLLKYYDEQIQEIDTRLKLINVTHIDGEQEDLVDESDLTDKDINFFSLLSKYENSIYNKVDLAILTKQIVSIFDNNPVFKDLGVDISKEVLPKKKRSANGFESNFLYLDTLLGIVECQLQTDYQYKDGNYGFPAHGNMKGKALNPLPIPPKNKQAEIKEFITKVNQISPKSFFAKLDNAEKGKVTFQQYGDYQNYRNLLTQITKGSTMEKLLNNYFAKLYAIRNNIFQNQDMYYNYIEYDVDEYIKSDEFKKLKEKYSNKEQHRQDKEEQEHQEEL